MEFTDQKLSQPGSENQNRDKVFTQDHCGSLMEVAGTYIQKTNILPHEMCSLVDTVWAERLGQAKGDMERDLGER